MSTQILLDTNILLRAHNPESEHCEIARNALRTQVAAGDELCIVPQSCHESWAVASRAVEHNGLRMNAEEIASALDDFVKAFMWLHDIPALFEEWLRLVREYSLQGKPSHDARFIAAMKAHGISHIFTFNAKDFRRYEIKEGIVVRTPDIAHE